MKKQFGTRALHGYFLLVGLFPGDPGDDCVLVPLPVVRLGKQVLHAFLGESDAPKSAASQTIAWFLLCT